MNKFFFVALSCAIASVPTVAQAGKGCFSGETDGSQWLEKTIELNPGAIINYNSSRYGDVQSFVFDFGHEEIENPRSFSLRAVLASPTTEVQSVWGVLENANGLSGGSVNAGRNELYTNLNNEQYFNVLKTGKINLGLGRTGSNETLEITKITARFCGVVVNTGDSVTVDANKYNFGTDYTAETLVHFLEADTTYRVEVNGTAIDGNGNVIPAVNVNYVDPRKSQNITSQLVSGSESFIHSNGKISLFYSTDTSNRGGHTVTFSRVNLD